MIFVMELDGYISTSEYARYKGCSQQTVYNMVRKGLLASRTYKRKSMLGLLVAKPLGYDDWVKQLKTEQYGQQE